MDANEHTPVIDHLEIIAKSQYKNLLQLKRIKHDQYTALINKDSLLLNGRPMIAFEAVELLKIHAHDDDLPGSNNSRVLFKLDKVRYYEINRRANQQTRTHASKEVISTNVPSFKLIFNAITAQSKQIFQLDEANGHLKMLLSRIDLTLPFISFVNIELSDLGQPQLKTGLNLVLVFVNDSILKTNLINFDEINKFFNSKLANGQISPAKTDEELIFWLENYAGTGNGNEGGSGQAWVNHMLNQGV